MARHGREGRKRKSAQRFIRLDSVCETLELTTHTLVRYERQGLIHIERVETSEGVWQALLPITELERLHRIRLMTDELGVNLAGVEIILRLLDRLEER